MAEREYHSKSEMRRIELMKSDEETNMASKVLMKTDALHKEMMEHGIDTNSFLLYKISTLFVMIEEQNKTIKQLTETFNKIIDNA